MCAYFLWETCIYGKVHTAYSVRIGGKLLDTLNRFINNSISVDFLLLRFAFFLRRLHSFSFICRIHYSRIIWLLSIFQCTSRSFEILLYSRFESDTRKRKRNECRIIRMKCNFSVIVGRWCRVSEKITAESVEFFDCCVSEWLVQAFW